MREKGTVSKILPNNLAEVTLHQGSSCAGCGVCREGAEETMIVEVNNPVGAKVGEAVELEIPTRDLIFSSAVVFLLPIIMMIVGYILGNYYYREIVGIICALVFLFGGLGLARLHAVKRGTIL